MGADGGTMPTRDEMIKMKKKAKKVDKDVDIEARWRRCYLSAAILKEPIVACGAGRLYNKDTIIEYLLDKAKFLDQATLVKHIRGLKDIVTLNLTRNPEYTAAVANQGPINIDENTSPYMCPVTDLPMNGHYRFSYIKTCGCVVSDKALREIPTDTCHVCSKPFTINDVITINANKEIEDEIIERLLEKQAAKKKDKKKAKEAVGGEDLKLKSSCKRSFEEASNRITKKPKDMAIRAPAL
eukprot:Ihof_evm6s93 gene=Ihof_evmTU6s93